ncbi:histone deacetylase complex subunit SAP18 [Histomonas meleagridis]|uniref:histone deacetylase complex subunit SAP18 n=1 Tax=Histomonas meleagridis TaxID=135588 RepID=UPI00355A5895|nr:histone deacetylase complex subunit SAP18 [Histomonas meleagridis]KAH0799234.1 histone deacetylase complex subunit SAP18 [Histomonas meleagridis]
MNTEIVNRLETCPTLIRVFYQKNAHHTIVDFVKSFPSPELYLYTWADATLKELAYTIIQTARIASVHTISFKMLVPDLNEGGWIIKPLGIVDLTSTEPTDVVTLKDFGFRPGYLMDVAYTIAT